MNQSSIFIFLFTYLFISFSILGYGLFIERIYLKKSLGKDLGFTGLLGIFVSILYSYISHYFVAHTIFHNSVFLIIGLIFFIFLYNNLSNKEYVIILLLLILISFISLLLFKTHDDFHYYHFPYSYYLTQFPALIGIGQFNHGFRTPSSIFYINSLFYLPIVKYFTFYISAVLFLVFSNLILLVKIIEKFKAKKTHFISYLCLLFFIFINIFFYRIQEHGADRSAQILVLILILYLISFINFEKSFELDLTKICVVLGLIISLKALFLLYLTLSIPIIYILIKEKKSFLIFQIFKNKFFWLSLVLLLNVLLVYFINTGCLIYPAKLFCFDSFSWSLSLAEVDKMNIHYEAWSKGGKNPIFTVDNPSEHIKYLNWLPLWIEIYFFNKVSDFLLGLVFVMLLMTIIFYKKDRIDFNINKNINYIIGIIIIFFFEWFYNHPSLRYGGYCLLVIMFFLPFSIFLNKFNNSIKEKKLKFICIISFVCIVFIGRNISRISDEINKYSYKPVKETYYKVDKVHFRINDEFNMLIENFIRCKKKEINCNIDQEPQMKKIFNNRYIFTSNK